MPLSEHEQRILAELEDSLVREDPRFAERVRTKTVYRHAGRQCKWAAFGFLAGLAVLVALYSQSVVLGLVGVALMFVSAVVFERNLRRLGRASWHDLTRSRRPEEQSAGFEHALHDTKEWLRSHFFRREH
ncbi:MAG: DUF3040 domain-containing protein [Acidimicrobiales bacterium]